MKPNKAHTVCNVVRLSIAIETLRFVATVAHCRPVGFKNEFAKNQAFTVLKTVAKIIMNIALLFPL